MIFEICKINIFFINCYLNLLIDLLKKIKYIIIKKLSNKFD